VVGDQLYNGHSEVVGTHGFYVDVSPLADQEREDLVTAKLAEITEQRASIEQAKGMLMVIYGISDTAAFDLMKWLSQEANVKLRLLAEQITEDFRSVGPTLTSQSEFDHLLLTARSRIDRVDKQVSTTSSQAAQTGT
jgi:ANTAR domain